MKIPKKRIKSKNSPGKLNILGAINTAGYGLINPQQSHAQYAGCVELVYIKISLVLETRCQPYLYFYIAVTSLHISVIKLTKSYRKFCVFIFLIIIPFQIFEYSCANTKFCRFPQPKQLLRNYKLLPFNFLLNC